MSAFSRSRRQVWLDADLIDLVRVAAAHEQGVPAGEVGIEVDGKSIMFTTHTPHTAETLLDHIVRDYFQREDKVKYRSLLELREKAREEADARWKALTKDLRPSSNAQPLSPSGPSAQESD